MVLFSCDDQLDEVPNKQTDIIPTAVDHLSYLLNKQDVKKTDADMYTALGDDFKPSKEWQKANNFAYTNGDYEVYGWDWDILLQPNVGNNFYDQEYQRILMANTILGYADQVEGTEEEINRIKGDAYFLRAYSHFALARTFALPYDNNAASNLGIAIKDNASVDKFPNRSTLEETYNFILSDLEKAREYLKDISLSRSKDGPTEQWRASSAAAYAFSAKVYLAKGDFVNAEKNADLALANLGEARLINYNTEMGYSVYPPEEVTVYYQEGVPTTEAIRNPKTSDFEFKAYDWDEMLFYQQNNSRMWYVPSDDLIAAYGTETERNLDLRWKYNFIENYSFTNEKLRGNNETGEDFVPAVKIPAYGGLTKTGLTVGEVYLIKAECQVRNNSDISGAQQTVNNFRAHRIDEAAPEDYKNLSFSGKDDAIRKILEEKRRELPFIERWYDVKRIAGYGEFGNVSTVVRDWYAYDLTGVSDTEKQFTFDPEADYKKLAFPIPTKEIETLATYGVEMKQNEY